MTTHTPGPWGLEYDGSLVIGGQVVTGPFGPDGASHEERAANMHLIAASPDLLEACKHAVMCCPDPRVERELLRAIADAE